MIIRPRGEKWLPGNCLCSRHDSKLGNAPAHKLFDLVTASAKDETKPARGYGDYAVDIDQDGVPDGVTLIEKC